MYRRAKNMSCGLYQQYLNHSKNITIRVSAALGLTGRFSDARMDWPNFSQLLFAPNRSEFSESQLIWLPFLMDLSKHKSHWAKVNRQRSLLQTWREGKTQFEPYPPKKARIFLKARVMGIDLRPPVFTNWFYYSSPPNKSIFSPVFITGGSFTPWYKGLLKVRHLLSPLKLGGGALLPLMLTVQTDDGLRLQNWSVSFARFTSLRGTERIYNNKFSKVKAPRERRHGLDLGRRLSKGQPGWEEASDFLGKSLRHNLANVNVLFIGELLNCIPSVLSLSR